MGQKNLESSWKFVPKNPVPEIRTIPVAFGAPCFPIRGVGVTVLGSEKPGKLMDIRPETSCLRHPHNPHWCSELCFSIHGVGVTVLGQNNLEDSLKFVPTNNVPEIRTVPLAFGALCVHPWGWGLPLRVRKSWKAREIHPGKSCHRKPHNFQPETPSQGPLRKPLWDLSLRDPHNPIVGGR